MRKHLKYLSYVVRHKWFVFCAGFRVGGIQLWRLIVHDWSKLTPAEWVPYVEKFYGDGKRHCSMCHGTCYAVQDAFERAFLHHVHHNPHHWEYWVKVKDSEALEQPVALTHEMVADWMGAGRAITGDWNDVHRWYAENKDKIILHASTRIEVERLLETLKP